MWQANVTLEEAFPFYMHWKECLFSDCASCGTFVCQLMTTNWCFVLSQSDSFIDMEIYFVINLCYQKSFIWELFIKLYWKLFRDFKNKACYFKTKYFFQFFCANYSNGKIISKLEICQANNKFKHWEKKTGMQIKLLPAESSDNKNFQVKPFFTFRISSFLNSYTAG